LLTDAARRRSTAGIAMIAVTFALPQESKNLLSTLRHAAPDGSLGIVIGNIGGRKIALAHTGLGIASAAANVRALLAAHRPEYMISAGYAGGLEERLCVGDLVVATNYSTPELLERCRTQCGASFHLACETVPGAASSIDPAAGPRMFFGSLTTQPEAIEKRVAKARLALETSALAVDMETSAVATECARTGVPLLAIRVISDDAATDLPVPMAHWFDLRRQRPRAAALIAYLARHPTRIAPFIRFVSALPGVRAVLTRAILTMIGES
jgi:adenosylhomocysteine nucleosidase